MTLTIGQEAAGVEPATIRAILVDPTDSSIRNIDLPTAPGPARGLGIQIEPDRLVALLGKRVSQIDLFDGEVLARRHKWPVLALRSRRPASGAGSNPALRPGERHLRRQPADP